MFDNIFNKPLFSKIDIITQNITINPPINNVVFIALKIEFDKISPKFASEISLEGKRGLAPFSLFSTKVFLFLGFHHLNIKPTVKPAKICVINNKIPTCLFLNKPIPTVPIIKSGPELFVNDISLSASISEILP